MNIVQIRKGGIPKPHVEYNIEEVENLIIEDMKKKGYSPDEVKFVTSCGNKYNDDGDYLGHFTTFKGIFVSFIKEEIK